MSDAPLANDATPCTAVENLFADFGDAFAYQLQGPVKAAAQIVDGIAHTNLAESTAFSEEPLPKEFATAGWAAQQLGAGAGMLPWIVGLKKVASSALTSKTFERLSGMSAPSMSGAGMSASSLSEKLVPDVLNVRGIPKNFRTPAAVQLTQAETSALTAKIPPALKVGAMDAPPQIKSVGLPQFRITESAALPQNTQPSTDQLLKAGLVVTATGLGLAAILSEPYRAKQQDCEQSSSAKIMAPEQHSAISN